MCAGANLFVLEVLLQVFMIIVRIQEDVSVLIVEVEMIQNGFLEKYVILRFLREVTYETS